jgi:hypothetical protein
MDKVLVTTINNNMEQDTTPKICYCFVVPKVFRWNWKQCNKKQEDKKRWRFFLCSIFGRCDDIILLMFNDWCYLMMCCCNTWWLFSTQESWHGSVALAGAYQGIYGTWTDWTTAANTNLCLMHTRVCCSW